MKSIWRHYSKTILFRRRLTGNENSSGDSCIKVRELKAEDIAYLKSINYGDADTYRMLQEADACFVGLMEGACVHHTCVAMRSFRHPRMTEAVRVGPQEAYVYGVVTLPEARGHGVTPAVYNHLHMDLYNGGVQSVYSQVWQGNRGSQRAFQKVGYNPYGTLDRYVCGRHGWWLLRADRPYFVDKPTCRLGSMRLYRAAIQDWIRIANEMKPLIKEWKQKGLRVAIWGAGGHSSVLCKEVDFPKEMISVVVDTDPTKTNHLFAPLGLPVFPPEVLHDEPADVVIASSKGFQDSIVKMIEEQPGLSKRLVVLYPHVAYVKK